jgi:FkbM family methyltransferase
LARCAPEVEGYLILGGLVTSELTAGTGRKAMKRSIQALLRRFGLLERLQNSLLYDLYWSVVDRQWIDKRHNEVGFYRDLLTGFQRGELIFDVGANAGEKTDVFLRLGARVLAVEPDESNQEVLRRKFLRYRLLKKPVIVLGKALSDRNTVETMWIDAAGSALNTLSHKWVETLRHDADRFGQSLAFKDERQVPTTTLEDLFASYGVPFFVKIDVEGYELNVLRGMKCSVPFLSFEVNLPEFKSEGLQCITALGSLAEEGKFNFAVDCQRGLALDQWLGARDFTNLFKECEERAVEVFWKTGLRGVERIRERSVDP